jgi:2Fe-2S ferredoxin
MPVIHFKNGRQALTVPTDSNLMQALLAGGLPVASSCKGDGVCAKCRIQITEGARNLSPQNEVEIFLRERHGLNADERISCQTQVLGDITVATGYW